MCSTVVSFEDYFSNSILILKPGDLVAISQISFVKSENHNRSNIVNIYCDSLYCDITNPQGILRTLVLPPDQDSFIYNFQDDLFFFEIGVLKEYIKITLDRGFKIKYYLLIVKKENES